MSISESVDQQIAEMIADGRDPGGIVLTPQQLMRWRSQITGPDSLFTMAREGSGWAYRGLTIYRSYHVSGPAVVDRWALDAMLRWRNMDLPDAGFAQELGNESVPSTQLERVLF